MMALEVVVVEEEEEEEKEKEEEEEEEEKHIHSLATHSQNCHAAYADLWSS